MFVGHPPMPMKTEDGKQYAREAYLIAPGDNVSDWKLRVEEEPGKVTVAQLGRAAAALSPGGYRGNPVELSAADRKTAARKLIALYHRHDVDEADIPDHLYETAGMKAPSDSEDRSAGKSLSDTLVTFGGALKALGDGRIGGYLVTFGGRDLQGEYYTPSTYFGPRDGDGADCLFHHSLPIKGISQELTDHLFQPIKAVKDETGIFAETVLDMADAYEQKVYAMVKGGKLGWSSGSGAHLVRVKEDGEITRWPIVEGSITPQPVDPRNRALPLKSLIDDIFPAGLTDSLLREPTTVADFLQAVSALPLSESADAVVSAVKAFNARMAERAEFRIKDGRVLSEANLTKIQTVSDHLDEARRHVHDLLETGRQKAPNPEADRQDIDPNALYARWLYNDAMIQGAIRP